jgi:hypothetical protein
MPRLSWQFKTTMGAALLLAAIGGVCAQPAAPSVLNLGGDEVRMVNGVRTACARAPFEASESGANPYSLRVAVTENGNFLPPRLTLAQGDQTLVRLTCKSEWVMFGLAPGNYTVSAALSNGMTVSKQIGVPQDGVVRTVLGRETPLVPSS